VLCLMWEMAVSISLSESSNCPPRKRDALGVPRRFLSHDAQYPGFFSLCTGYEGQSLRTCRSAQTQDGNGPVIGLSHHKISRHTV